MKNLTFLFVVLLSINIQAQNSDYQNTKESIVEIFENNFPTDNPLLKDINLKELKFINFRILKVTSLNEESIINALGLDNKNEFKVDAIIDIIDREKSIDPLTLVIRFETEKILNTLQVNNVKIVGINTEFNYTSLENENIYILKEFKKGSVISQI